MITIEHCTAKHADLRQLISELDADLLLRYPAERIYGLDLNHPDIHKITFMVAYVDGQPAGCGAIRQLDAQYAELKRFFVRADQRRKGIASRLLAALETAAFAQGATGMRLETGDGQPEAIAFYERHGYVAIEPFGQYVGDEDSRCYEKALPSVTAQGERHVGN
ncbi:GNAT family N-acetyltransferase [Paenibacillus campi]|uniref:GNAT family N-acetyltransferase n=1 Tax=Paenibacillus campi TaxID=3106031 RepID=UPI002B001F45|nr:MULTISPECIES: GNAT family N-acetyltransferase [unclassified Paenibacillus]